jgi:hypothetical protein
MNLNLFKSAEQSIQEGERVVANFATSSTRLRIRTADRRNTPMPLPNSTIVE